MIEITTSQAGVADPFAGPAWNNFVEYPSVDSAEFKADLADAQVLIQRVEKLTAEARPTMRKVSEPDFTLNERNFLIRSLQEISAVRERASILLENLATYVSCELSIESGDDEAQRVQTQLATLKSQLTAEARPYQLYLEQASEEVLKSYLESPRTAHEEPKFRRARAQRDFLLSENEEVLINRLNTHGPEASGQLYNQICGALICRVRDGSSIKEIGLAEATGLLRDPSEFVRKSAWLAIQEAWQAQSIPCAAILNELAGWRLELTRLRSHTREADFLTAPLDTSRLQRASLDQLIRTLDSARSIGRRGAAALAKALGKSRLDPWDIVSSAPLPATEPLTENRVPFKQALLMIKRAFSDVDPKLGEFVSMMERNRWLEGRVSQGKRQGAYCTEFPKSRSPRVYQTYMGSFSDIRTLAHELGHAYHSWVLRPLPFDPDAPMTLAETASLFAETLVSDQIETTGSNSEQFAIGWQNVVSAVMMLLNIPSRFAFEKAFYEKRGDGFVSANELSDLTEIAWDHWYGPVLSVPERQWWMTKLHFSMSSLSFYNFPYVFGYLLSLAVYAKRETLPRDAFLPFYDQLLTDTNSMSCEELINKHFRADLTDAKSAEAFWSTSLKMVEKQIARFERMLETPR